MPNLQTQQMPTNKYNKRLHVVDALRGFAIISIMLLHNLEHFDFYYQAEGLPEWMIQLDKVIWDTLFFLFSGKSFAIFALLFGLTFYIQFNNQAQKGNDFRPRFAWRMILLFGFGIINSAIFQGDILGMYALIGLFMIPLAKLNNKILTFIAIVLLLQPIEIIPLIKAIQHPEMPVPEAKCWQYFANQMNYIPGRSLLKTIQGNLINGHKAVWLWSLNNGRFFQILSLFIFGYIIGRKKLFEWNTLNKKIWIKVLVVASILFFPLFYFSENISHFIPSEAIDAILYKICKPWSNLAFMMLLVSGFTLLFHHKSFHNILNVLSPVGKMSLSNYIFQSFFGAFIYYGFGLGLYKYTGATYSLLIGLILSTLFIVACTYWDKTHKHGPLEFIWHKLTWIKFRRFYSDERISSENLLPKSN